MDVCTTRLSTLTSSVDDTSRLFAGDGPYQKRESWAVFAQWVALSGGRVKGVSWKQQQAFVKGYSNEHTLIEDDEVPGMSEDEHTLRNVWPLQLVDLGDDEQIEVLYELLHDQPQVVKEALFMSNGVFERTMKFQQMKLTNALLANAAKNHA